MFKQTVLAAAGTIVILTMPSLALAHCDTMDGPVILDARTALEKGDVSPVLKWVSQENEQEIIGAFRHTLAVRKLSPDARELADNYFFETLVRVHRMGEGAPYTGLKPAGGEIDPIIATSDSALQNHNLHPLMETLVGLLQNGVKERFEKVEATKTHAEHNVLAGREYVEAYVSFIHYVENINEYLNPGQTNHFDSEEPIQHQH